MNKRLQIILSHGGIASRRKAAEIIETGRVMVNGVTVRERGFQVDPDKDTVEIDGKRIHTEKNVYYVLNKPKGFITTASDEKGRRTVLDLVTRVRFRVYPVGRLDKETEGVLLLTNDGDLAHRLTHQKFGVKKVYTVEIKGDVMDSDLRRLERGVYMDGKKTSRCKIEVLDRTHDKLVLRIELHEGRKRQIRRMMDQLGAKVKRLRRISYGDITAKGLEIGQYRPLAKKEVASLLGMCFLK